MLQLHESKSSVDIPVIQRLKCPDWILRVEVHSCITVEGSRHCDPWLSCGWSQRTQLVLGFCPNSWARVFWNPLQSSLKEDSQVEALRTS